MSFFEQLKRRNVYRAGVAYVVTAWLIIQVVETVFPAFGFGEGAIRTVIIILSIGFVPAVVSAWVFELTPGGLIRESEIDHTSPVFRKMDKRIDRLVMVALALAVGYFLFDHIVLSPQRESEIEQMAHKAGGQQALLEAEAARTDRSVVVLPFVDMSQNQDQEFFADGLADELTTLLTKIPELRVISRTSAFAFKNKIMDVSQIARQLNVAYVLEGSVRVDGTRIRITTQLINASDDQHIWAQNYDRDLTEVFAIQDEVAILVVRQLEATLADELPRVERTNPEAYALYLQSKSDDYSVEAVAAAVEKLEQALVIDPQYVPAWFSLGRLYFLQHFNGMRQDRKGINLAWSAVENALRLDPFFAPAHALMGTLTIQGNDLPGSVAHYERALELAPADPDVLDQIVVLLQALNRFDEADQILQYQLLRNPLSERVLLNIAINYLFARRLEDAELYWRRILALDSDTIWSQPMYAVTLALLGKYQEALEETQNLEEGLIKKWILLVIYQQQGPKEKFDAGLMEMKQMEGEKPKGAFFGVYASLGDADAAFDRARFGQGFPRQRFNPMWWPIENDPRWQQLLEELGCSDRQISEMEFNFKLPIAH